MKKLLSIVMAVAMLVSATAGIEITANAYTATGSGYNMTIGESVSITDTNMDNGTDFNKTWSSSNTSVATVSSTGKQSARVTAKSEGRCTITCYTESWVTINIYNSYTKRWEPQTNYKYTRHYYEINVSKETTTTTTTTTTVSEDDTYNYSSQENPNGSVAVQPSDNNETAEKSVAKPKKTAVKTLKSGKKQFKANWKKVNGVSGYQLQYATDKKFKKNKKTITLKSSKTTSKTVKKLKSKKTYYVRVRSYKTVNGKKVYSSWSKAKSVKVK